MSYQKLIFNLTNRLGFVTVGKLISFLTVPLITRALGPEQYGIYSYVVTIAGYAFIFGNWGFLAKGIRDIAKKELPPTYVVSRILSARITLWAIGGVFTLIVCFLIWGASKLNLFIFFAILTNLGLAATIDYYFYGIKNTFLPSVSHLFGQIIFLVLVWLFVRSKNDLLILLGINIFYRLFEALLLIFVFKKKHPLHLKLSPSNAISLLNENFYLGLGSKASFLQNSLPILLIPVFLSKHDLGVYSATYKIFVVLGVVIQSMNLVFSPWIVESRKASINKKINIFKKLIVGYFILGILLSLFILFSGTFLINFLFGSEFKEAHEIMNYFALFLIPIWPVFMLLSSYMNNFEKDKKFFISNLIQVLILAVCLPLLLSLLGLLGVIISLATSTLFLILYYFFHLNHEFKQKV